MKSIAKRYRPRGEDEETTLQDFHTFRQALNVASADQRLLLFVAAPESRREGIRPTLRPVFADEEVIGRFHLDFAGENDAGWKDAISRSGDASGYVIIRADRYGQEGEAMTRLPLNATGEEIKAALLAANEEFADTEKRKDYAQHVSAGRRAGVYFENGMPYGEDRDGDGEIDHVGGQGKGKGPEGAAGKGTSRGKGKGAPKTKGPGFGFSPKGKGPEKGQPKRPPLE